MPSSNEIGLPSPVIDDSPDVPRDFLALNNAIKPMVVPRFGSTTARDAAFGAGQFRLATVGDVLWVRRGSTWTSVLADADINTTWLAPTMGSGWSSLSADPARYRISAGQVQWRGVAFNSSGVPGTSSMMVVPSNALPSNASGWADVNYAETCVATSLATGSPTPAAFGYINLRPSGSVVCVLPGGTVSGATKVSLYSQGWFIT